MFRSCPFPLTCFRRSFSGTTPRGNETQHDFTSTPDNDPAVQLLENLTWGAGTTQGITDNYYDNGDNHNGNNHTGNNYNNGNNYSGPHDNNTNDNGYNTIPNAGTTFDETLGKILHMSELGGEFFL